MFLRSLICIHFLILFGPLHAQQDRLALLNERNGDTLWLDPAGVVEVWLGDLALGGSIIAWTDSTLVFRTMEEEEGPISEDHVLNKADVTLLYYWRKHGTGRSFDPEKNSRTVRRMDYIAMGGMFAGVGLIFLGQGELGAAIAIGSLGYHVVARYIHGRQWVRFRMQRRWSWAKTGSHEVMQPAIEGYLHP